MEKKELSIYSFTETGSGLAAELYAGLQSAGYTCRAYALGRFAQKRGLLGLAPDWKETLGKSWGKEGLIFIGAAGIAVRAIAPYVKDKFSDPPVVVLDEKGRFAIPLLSGHVGGGVELAGLLQELIGAEAVITTATDVQQKFAVDVFAVRNGLLLSGREEAKNISACILEGKKTGIFSEFPMEGAVPKELTVCASRSGLDACSGKIVVCQRLPQKKESGVLYLFPKNVYVGMGCRRGVEKESLVRELDRVLSENGLLRKQVRAVGSIDLKKDEAGLIGLAEELGAAFRTFSAEELEAAGAVSAPSEFVRQVTGVDNVCERAARLLCPDGLMLQKKVKLDRCTAALVCGQPTLLFDRKEGRAE